MKQSKWRTLFKRVSVKSKPDNFNDNWKDSYKVTKVANAFVPIKSIKEKAINTKEKLTRAKELFGDLFLFFKGLFGYAIETKNMLLDPTKRPKSAVVTKEFSFKDKLMIAQQMLILLMVCGLIFLFWIFFVKTHVNRTGAFPIFSIGHLILVGLISYTYSYYRTYTKYSGKLSNVVRGHVMFYLSKKNSAIMLLDSSKDNISEKGIGFMRLSNIVIVVLTLLVFGKIVYDSFLKVQAGIGIDILTPQFFILSVLLWYSIKHYQIYQAYK
jgi:hypothetical protein